MADIASLETDLTECKSQIETVALGLEVDPDNVELNSLKTELEEYITVLQTQIAELKPTAPAKPAPKSGRFKDNGFQKPTEHPEEAPAVTTTPVSFSVNDIVLARWVSGDHGFYPAKINSITGSSTNPVYLVTFKSYATVENLTAKDIRPISGTDSRKRKADGTPGSSAPPSPALPHPGVISAAADINPALATQARNEPNKASDGLVRPAKMPRKVKAGKELEEGKNKWKDFAAKTKGKGKGAFGKKESMFRTGEGVNARVGFTGSGQTMRKDPTRTRHVYQQTDDDGF
ncbi:hypothetical protein LT330_008855 [Penicillium expansum]|uniref:DNA repair protein Crb2 Tudor domain-containing protein n=1 Tax=Penicillium expansum TaxID=27334 RepID=A0A0A2JHL3_PENEN|nr:hypothetical protein PEX2_065200 [Penicillium expansum]KAK4866115.1 hypothetical protein LT330_008855 [Penicillium expansum]KGO48957.1 hypothetical protein PEXP_010060 [Penicillium expansum]KGO51800.1 hypothetical protein PEX2_065200 [Penicillium expansum]KGO68662.1 hypothetical protein PEX1_013780 [Penicillium expansum]